MKPGKMKETIVDPVAPTRERMKPKSLTNVARR
jgi:hypothetical protein